jgi:threonine dehydrogenase-like Zn-dependent dehydrogenase
MRTMKAAVFLRPGKIELAQKPIPAAGPGQALVKISTTTICGTDIHILTGDYPVKAGLTIGHEPVGVIAELGAGVMGYAVDQIEQAYDLFASQRDGVLKVAITM